MKKLLAVLPVLLLLVFVLPSTYVNANSIDTSTFSTGEYEVRLLSPRMHYRTDVFGDNYPLLIRFDYGGRANVPYSFQLIRLDKNGNGVEIIRTFEGVTPDDGVIFIMHVFEEAGFPYEVVDTINNISIMKGYVLDSPSPDFRTAGGGRESNFAIAINDVAYNTGTGFLFDAKNPLQHLVKLGDYFILHYRMPSNSPNNDFRIKIAYENENIIFLEFSMDDIYTFQGGNTIDYRNAFIIVSTNGEIPAFVDNRNNIAVASFTRADNPFTARFEKGVYTMAAFDNQNVKRADGQSPILIGNNALREWLLTTDSPSVRQGYLIRWNVFRETKEISDVFSSHRFIDVPRQEDFGELISRDYRRIVNIRYIVSDDVGVGENGSVYWYIENPNDWFFGVGSWQFKYVLTSDYSIRLPIPIQDSLKDFLAAFGLDNTIGYMIFSVIVMVAVSFVLAYYGAGTTIIAVANFGLIGIFATMGFIPLWLIVGMVMFAVIGLVTVFKGREG